MKEPKKPAMPAPTEHKSPMHAKMAALRAKRGTKPKAPQGPGLMDTLGNLKAKKNLKPY